MPALGCFPRLVSWREWRQAWETELSFDAPAERSYREGATSFLIGEAISAYTPRHWRSFCDRSWSQLKECQSVEVKSNTCSYFLDTICVPVYLASKRLNTNRGARGKCSVITSTPSRAASPVHRSVRTKFHFHKSNHANHDHANIKTMRIHEGELWALSPTNNKKGQ